MASKRKSLSQSPSTFEPKNSKRARRNEDDDDDSTLVESSQISKGRAGRILNVHIWNFMCHSNLSVDFNLNTNFLIGRNGSGKSAILTALIVGLGGKARLTNRGTNMKGFIKVGQTSATVEITLSNTGSMAYNTKIYGPKITVSRTFTENTNHYKLLNSKGKTISTSFKDLCRLVEYLNIQVDNPVCLLNQDTARTFLNTNDQKKKYTMFMKATNLENIKEQIALSKSNANQTTKISLTKNQSIKKLESEVKKALKRYNAFANMQEFDMKRRMLQQEVVWSQVNRMEEEYAAHQKVVDAKTKEFTDYEVEVKNKTATKNKWLENLKQIQNQLLEIRNEEQGHRDQINKKKEELSNIRMMISGKNNDVISVRKYIKRKIVDKQTIETQIANSSEDQKNRMRMIQEREKQLEKLQDKLTSMSKLTESTRNDLVQTSNAFQRKQQEFSDLKTEYNELNTKNRQLQSKLRSLKTDETSSLNVYGHNIQKIVQCVNASKEQFIKMPLGPIGSYIKLKDKKWALAIEDIISTGILISFCVDNQQDAKILNKIFDDICGSSSRPTIISSKFFNKVHDYSKLKVQPPPECFALIDALIISNPVIINCLIDQIQAENILLISTNELARNLMSDRSRVPKNCAKAITISGDQFFPDPAYRTYAYRSKNPKFLEMNVSQVIKLYEEELHALNENQKIVQNQKLAVEQDLKKLQQNRRNLQEQVNKYDFAQNQLTQSMQDLKLQTIPVEQNIQILTEEMEEIDKIVVKKESDLQKLLEVIKIEEEKMEEVKSSDTDLRNISKALAIRMTPLIEQNTECETKIKQLEANSKYNKERIKQFENSLKAAQEELKSKEKLTEEKMQKALKLGPKVETNRTLEEVVAEMTEVNKQLEEMRSLTGGDVTSAQKSYVTLHGKFEKISLELFKIKTCLDSLKATLIERRRTYYQTVEYIGMRVRDMFKGVLRLRQFQGSITIDHDNKTLDMVVHPKQGSSQGSGQTHILSGGERSYSTVAFLHSLWQVMEYPFYFLDEFDVFMDKVNRRTVMDIIIEHATEQSHLQFVFLTPQDVSGVVGNPKISVNKMADPERSKALSQQ